MLLLPLLFGLLPQITQPADAVTTPDGTRLRPGSVCYAIVQDGKVVGATLQVIRAGRAGAKRMWDIVVHQRAGAAFDMRDHFLVARSDLRPISFDNRRGSEGSKGWHRVALDYGPGRITGTRTDATGSSKIDVPLTGPIWEGDLWGVTFGALPLASGARFTLPFWQYDKKFGSFIVNVVGEEKAAAPDGTMVDSWIVEAGDDPAQLVHYRLAKNTGEELGYRIGGFEQRPGGDCTGLD